MLTQKLPVDLGWNCGKQADLVDASRAQIASPFAELGNPVAQQRAGGDHRHGKAR